MSVIHIFIAYARKDTPYLDKLRVYLRPIDRNPNVKIWYDGLIDPGAEWEESIKTHLYKADIILLLMSAHSLNSDFFYEREMKKAMEQHHSGKSIVIPVILSHCLWDDLDLQLADLQALPKDGIPITKWEHESEAYDYIARGVRKSVQVVKAKRKAAKEKAERERKAAELARQRKIEEARKKERLTARQKEKEEKERLQRIADRKEKEKRKRLRKEQAAVAKRKHNENTANKLLELEEGEQKKEGDKIPPMINAKFNKNSSWMKMGIGGIALFIFVIWGVFNFTGMSEEEKIQIQKLIDDMVLVKGGTFTMGCISTRDDHCYGYELPIHKVTLSNFQIGKYEVTQAQWNAVMGENPSYFSDCKTCPVESVTWDDAQTFIQNLNQKTGKSFRLPTEAEWEFAARGGNQSKSYKYAGGNELEKVAWHSKNSNDKTHAIGGKEPNELGLCDMSGNVWEWCEDWYEIYDSSSVTNPSGAENGASRVIRGGSWLDTHTYRISNRNGDAPTIRDNDVGFRLAQ